MWLLGAFSSGLCAALTEQSSETTWPRISSRNHFMSFISLIFLSLISYIFNAYGILFQNTKESLYKFLPFFLCIVLFLLFLLTISCHQHGILKWMNILKWISFLFTESPKSSFGHLVWCTSDTNSREKLSNVMICQSNWFNKELITDK